MDRSEPLIAAETLGPCPPWCEGVHAEEGERWGISQFHATRPLELHVELGEYEYLVFEAEIVQYPRATRPERRPAYISLNMSLGDVEMEPEYCEALAVALAGYLPQLRQLAARLVEIRAADRAAQAWRT